MRPRAGKGYICSNRSRCGFRRQGHWVEQRRLLVEDILWRDVQSRRSGSKLCLWGVQDNREKDVQALLSEISTS